MKYTEEEILAYARSRIRHIDQQKGKRSALGFMGISVIVIFLCLIQMIREKSERAGADSFLDAHFIEGIAMGVFGIVALGFSTLAFVQMFNALNGKENEALRLLVKLKDERSGG